MLVHCVNMHVELLLLRDEVSCFAPVLWLSMLLSVAEAYPFTLTLAALVNMLQTLIDLHGSDEGLGGKLTDDEIQIICGMYRCHAIPR